MPHWCLKNVVWNVCLKKFAYFVIWVEVFLNPCSICRSVFASVCGRIFMTENLWLYIVQKRVKPDIIRKSVHFVIFAFVTWISCCKNCQQISLLSPPPFFSSLVNYYGLLDDLSSQPSNCWWCQKVKYIVWVVQKLVIPPTTSAGRITNNKSDHLLSL